MSGPIMGRVAVPRGYAALRRSGASVIYGLGTPFLQLGRPATTQAGQDKTGHISAGPGEGIFYFGNVFPLKLQALLRFSRTGRTEKTIPELLKRVKNPYLTAADPLSVIRRALPTDTPINITNIQPRLKDGGVFVTFSLPQGFTSEQIEQKLQLHLEEQPIKQWFTPFRRVKAHIVRGRPWLEDLNWFPSSRLKVEFISTNPGTDAPALSQENLYALFRTYGKLADIIPQPPDSKVLPRFAFLDFSKITNAIMAKNCMHGFVLVDDAAGGKVGTVLRLAYERRAKAHWIRDWIVNHPRIVIPAIAALLATVTVAVFDPIRTFFVKAHIDKSFHLDNYKIYRWFRSQATDIFSFNKRESEKAGRRALREDRRDTIEQVQTWLMETAETFIVVQGPRGSGKKDLVLNEVLKDRPHTLVIDCKRIHESRSDSAIIRAAAAEVGYRPVFSWMNNISSLIDLAAQGTIGTKAGFSETLDNQLAKIWQNTAIALKQTALEGRSKDDADSGLGDDEWLEAHPEKRPVVVIDNFLHHDKENSVVYDKLSEWAAALVSARFAHVIFLTHDVSFSKSLSKALPDQFLRQISLGDYPAAVAKRFVVTHLEADSPSEESQDPQANTAGGNTIIEELDDCIGLLGGRLGDLEFLARRIKSGERPRRAVEEIIEQSASEILKLYLLDIDRSERKWTPEQAWLLVKMLAERDSIPYNQVLLSDIYKSGGGSVLQALEQAEMIQIQSDNGRPSAVRPGKPVYISAFQLLMKDHVLRSRLDLSTKSELIKVETATIEKCEQELSVLGALPGEGHGVETRVRWLVEKIRASQGVIERLEAESSGLKKVLKSEF